MFSFSLSKVFFYIPQLLLVFFFRLSRFKMPGLGMCTLLLRQCHELLMHQLDLSISLFNFFFFLKTPFCCCSVYTNLLQLESKKPTAFQGMGAQRPFSVFFSNCFFFIIHFYHSLFLFQSASNIAFCNNLLMKNKYSIAYVWWFNYHIIPQNCAHKDVALDDDNSDLTSVSSEFIPCVFCLVFVFILNTICLLLILFSFVLLFFFFQKATL